MLKSLAKWREAISFGIVRPNSVALVPPHRMCALDMCTLGLMLEIFKEAIKSWADLVTQSSSPKSGDKHLKADLLKILGRLRLAVYQRANMI